MNAERYLKVDQLVAVALELGPDERATYLDSACQGDADLRHEVESLLEACLQADQFIEKPALELAARSLAEDSRLSPAGRQIGRYEIISLLGAGGMGEVYLAHDRQMNRKAVLKLLPAEFTQSPDRVARFQRESRAASALNHPNIITIYEIGWEHGVHFIASEYVEGETLRQRIRRSKLGAKEAVEVAVQTASALAAAHEAGIVHRDIKPENLMIRRDGYVKVLDFGLAKLTETSDGDSRQTHLDQITQSGALLGTVNYMSPEQARGEEVDARTDIFSLGAVLYEMVTGVNPFKGGSMAATFDAILNRAPAAVTSHNPDLPVELDRVINRSLEKDRELRYQTASDMRAELKRLSRDLDSSPSQSSGAVQVGGSSENAWQLSVWLLAALAVIVLGGSLAAWRFLFSPSREPSPWLNAYTTRITDLAGEERSPSLAPDGKSIYYASMINGQWDIFWQRIGGSNPQNLTKNSNVDDEQPACSPDGNSVVFRSEREGGGLFVMGATGESTRKISEFGHNPAWSPDGKEIVCGTDRILDPKRRGSASQLWVIDLASGAKRQLPVEGDAAQPRWSPNGHRIAYYYRATDGRRDVWTVSAQGDHPLPVTHDDPVDWNPVWSGDGQYLYFVSDRKSVASLWRVRIDEESGKTLGEPEAVTGPVAEILQVDVARDGRRIVYTTQILSANIQSVGFDPARLTTSGEPVWVTQSSRTAGSPNVSPDGQMMAFHSLGSAQEDIWLARSDGSGDQINLTNDDYLDRSPRWSPDGQWLAFFSNRSGSNQVWIVKRDGSGKRQLTFAQPGAVFPFWAPDGKRLAFAQSNGGGTRIMEVDRAWDQQTPLALPTVNEAGDWFIGWSWSPDGKLIAGTVTGWHDAETRLRPGIYIYSLITRRYAKITDSGSRPEWLGDSRHFIFINRGPESAEQIFLADSQTQTGREIVSLPPPFFISSAGVAPDGRRIFYTANTRQVDIYMLSLDR